MENTNKGAEMKSGFDKWQFRVTGQEHTNF